MTPEQYARRYLRIQQSIRGEFQKTRNGLAVAALRFSKIKMTELIYALPIPKRPKSGKPQWRRTGNLRRQEQIEKPDPYTVVLINRAPYAEPRHEAGKPGRRNTMRPAHWRDELVEAFRSVVQDAYDLTIKKILRQEGGV